MTFTNGIKLYLKNPLGMFKEADRTGYREYLAEIFYLDFHRRAFSKTSSQRTASS